MYVSRPSLKNSHISYSLIGCGVVLSLIFPIILRKRMSVDKKKKAIEELEINNDMEGKLHDLQLSSDVGKDSGKYNAETALDAEVTSKENVEVDEWIGTIPSPTENFTVNH